LAALSPYYVATRYPEDRKLLGQRTTAEVAKSLIETAKEVLAWARQRLTSEDS
jgi:HEPN domain-containing protein